MELSLIPESAPFNAEQRAWLNGFLAGWLGLQGGPESAAMAAALGIPTALPLPAAPVAEPVKEPEPWHDPALAIDERLKLAEGKPAANLFMAAMAQLDCGSCGYQCRTYAEAIATGAEKRLNLCSPGGAETSKLLKKLVKQQMPSNNGEKPAADRHVKSERSAPWSRENPYTASVIHSLRLSGAGSEKETRHVELRLGVDGPAYEVGDSLGVFPENCPDLVNDIISALGASGDELVPGRAGDSNELRAALRCDVCLTEVTEPLLELLAASALDPKEAGLARACLDDDGSISGADVLDALRRFPSARLAPDEFVVALSELKPRLYSISSSPRRHPGEVHLTVRRVTFEANGRVRKGVASTMLADRVAPDSSLRVFVQKSHGFRLPANPDTPIIMIGPGTGIAPFRAFLQERAALGSTGKAWLFFGDQRAAHDYLYQDELAEMLGRGVLTHLDTAFSRDQERKIYVQDRLAERGAEVFEWIESGAHLYVCGDAKRMAADVDRALREILRYHGGMSEDAARAQLASLATAGRYLRDVY
jgi:sulfite reductase (NADPH) flavoprotein alpha-component